MRITMVRKTVTREKAFEIISKSIDKYADHALKDANNAERSTLKERELRRVRLEGTLHR